MAIFAGLALTSINASAVDSEGAQAELQATTRTETLKGGSTFDTAANILFSSDTNLTNTFTKGSEDGYIYYKLVLNQDGYIYFPDYFKYSNASSSGHLGTIYFYHSDTGNTLFWNSYGEYYKDQNLGLGAGTYYLRIYVGGESTGSTITMRMNFTVANNWEKESNDSFDAANTVNINQVYYGSNAENTQEDYFKFYISGKKSIDITVKNGNSMNVYLYKDNVGHDLIENWYQYSNNSGAVNDNSKQNLEQGWYYLRFNSNCQYWFKINTYTNYTVNFNTNGGTPVPNTQTVVSGGKVTKPSSDPSKTGYQFNYWCSDKACTREFDFNSDTITSNTTLYAKFTANKYNVYFYSMGGTNVSNQSVAYGKCATRPANPSRSGYTFKGWYTDYSCTNAYNFNSKVTGTVNLYAKWTKNVTPVTVTKVTMYRLYNKWTGEHFYTSDSSEKNNLVRGGWNNEGVGWYAPKSSNTRVYRLYNPYVAGGDHHYTTNVTEYNNLAKQGWKQEGVGWYSDDSKGVKLYRQYNPFAKTGTHNYTTSESENDKLVKLGWNAEGVGWYGVK